MLTQRCARSFVFGLLFLLHALAAQTNDAAQPYVLLVSFDGFRHDYASLYQASNLVKLGAAGATADALKPAFPPMTFSSHYTIVTGVHPDRHGIVGNSFFDPESEETYQFGANAPEAKWYRKPPIWVTAEQNGVRTATYAWPGSEAPIDGVRPSIWRPYSAKGTNDQQIDQAFEWLSLPVPQRPHLIVLYFNDVDTVGHRSGPEGPEIRSAVEELDRVIGRLHERVRQTPLPINIVVVSDHGMKAVTGRIALRDFTDLTKLRVISGGASIAHIYSQDPQAIDKAYNELKGKSPEFEVYRRAATPAHWHYTRDPRIGDLVIVATGSLAIDARPVEGPKPMTVNKGAHGYDPQLFPEMKGIFFAAGPNIRPGRRLKAFDAIHVYPLLAQLLGLKIPADIDGKSSVLNSIYRK